MTLCNIQGRRCKVGAKAYCAADLQNFERKPRSDQFWPIVECLPKVVRCQALLDGHQQMSEVHRHIVCATINQDSPNQVRTSCEQVQAVRECEQSIRHHLTTQSEMVSESEACGCHHDQRKGSPGSPERSAAQHQEDGHHCEFTGHWKQTSERPIQLVR